MFCDLAESTALSQRLDPEDLRDVLRSFQDTCTAIIERYEGHVSRYMGDGILVLFGYPTAHENDAERAVRAGLDIAKAVAGLTVSVEKVAPLGVRVGISSGLVVAGDVIGEGASEEEAVVGKTPNLASRLQGLAEANAVVISTETRNLLGNAFEYQFLGSRKLKGFELPVSMWRVIGPGTAESRFDAARAAALTPMVDREQELDLIYELWNGAKNESGQILLVSGEAGIGKSRLGKALSDRIAAEPHTRLQYQCSPYYQYTALYPFIVQLERAAGFEHEDSANAKLDKLRTLIDEETLPLFADLMSVPMESGADITALSPQRRKELTFKAIFSLLLERAAEQPVLATIEDAHWIDPTSLELMSFIIERMREACVLLVITFRPEFSLAWIDQAHVTALRLEGLSRQYGEALAENVLGERRLPSEVAQRIVDKTEGVPLFIEELAKSMMESGLLSAEEGRIVTTGPLPSETIPVTLMDSLMARVDRLGEAKAIAQIGAVIGQEFTHSLLASVAELPETELHVALERLVASELVFRRAGTTEIRFAFKHALVRDAAYDSLLRRRREALHGRIAESLEASFPETTANEPELLAHHYTRAGVTEKAILYWQLAGERASRRSANLEALSHLTNALELLENLPDTPVRRELELSLLTVLGPVQIAIKGSGSEEATNTYARAVELCTELPDSPSHFAAYWGQWATSRSYLTKRERADKLLVVAESLGDLGLHLQAHHCQWASLFNLGFHRQCCQHIELGLKLYDAGDFRSHATLYRGHDPAVCAHGEAALSLWLLGYPEKATARIEQALAVARTLSHAGSTAHAIDIALMLNFYRQDVSAVYARATELISLSAQEEFAVQRAKGEILRGWAGIRLGEGDQGIVGLRNGIDTLRTIGTSEDLPLFLEMLAEGYGVIGQPSEGLRALDAAFEESDKAALRYWVAELLRRKGELLLAMPESDEADAEACFTNSLQIARQQQAKSLELRAAKSYARLLENRGEAADGYDLLLPVYEWFTEGFDSVDLASARACLEELNPRSGTT
jgi:class 3 adenylate cyclase/predicted ATPase